MLQLEALFSTSGWFISGKTYPETVKQFKKFGYSEYDVYETILDMYSRGVLYTYPSKAGTCYRFTVQADIEFDISV